MMDYRKEIDGLRAIAVLPVILFHAGFQIFSGGFVGVDVFFVISGYLITSIILSEKKAGTFSLLNFWERRARRILPTLFFVMLVSIPFAWLWLLPNDMKDFSQSLVAVSFFASNILFWLKSGYFATEADLKPLLHTWSLSVEEQYYLLFPLLIMILWRFGKPRIISTLFTLFMLSLVLAQWAAYHKPTAAFYLLPTRGWELLIGAFIAFYLSNNRKIDANLHPVISNIFALIGMCLIVYSIVGFSEQTPFPSLYTLVPTLGAALIILFATSNTLIGKLLSNKILVGVGLISYSAYLWHQPLFAFARHYCLNEPSHWLLLTLCLTSLILAYFSWKYIETVFRNKQIIGRNAILYGSTSFAVCFIAFGLYASKASIRASNSAYEFNISRELTTSRDCSSNIFPESIRKNCTIIGSTSSPTILLMGDSHAEALRVELEKELVKRNLSAYSITLGGCTPVKNVSLNSEFFYDECIKLNSWLSDNLLYNDKNNNDIDTLIIFSRWTAHLLDASPFDNQEGGKEKELFTNSNNTKLTGIVNNQVTHDKAIIKQLYIEHFEKIKMKNIILVYPMPEAGWDIPKALSKLIKRKGIDNITAQSLSTSYELYQNRNQMTYEWLDELDSKIVRVKPENYFCNSMLPGRCVTQISGQPLYYDDDHISNQGARLVINEIMSKRELSDNSG